MVKIPYGQGDFKRLRTDGQLYFDRTKLLHDLEAAGRQLLFLRPRRFGKTLWLTLLENYYDIGAASQFETLFGDLAIGPNPTPNRNRYFILKWNFSVVDPNGDLTHITRSLHSHINGEIEFFAARYRAWLPDAIKIDERDALRSFKNLLTALKIVERPLYLLIDEYDNFANEVLTSREQGKKRYDELVAGEGVIKTVFKAVKAASDGSGLERVFITGVSPVVMSDITSGYNVAENISHWPEFHALCGLTVEELQPVCHQIAQHCQLPESAADEALAMMRNFYNGYRFCREEAQRLYNPTLTLYFLKHWQRRCSYPAELLDDNLAMDKNRLRYIASLPHGTEVIEAALNPQQPLQVEKLVQDFGVAAMLKDPSDASFIISLLVYFGVLTIQDVSPLGKLKVAIPNQVVRSLYIDRIQQQLLNGYEDNNRQQAVAEQLYTEADFEPLADFIEQRFYSVLDNRDMRWSNELTLKTTLLLLLTNDLYYLPRSELSLGGGYSDLLFEIRPDKRQAPLYDLLFELKYLSLKDLKLSAEQLSDMSREQLAELAPVKTLLDEAEVQLASYQPKLQQLFPAIEWQLKSFAVVSLGIRRLVWRDGCRVSAARPNSETIGAR
ncbi:AAA family ATPase [Ectothiorhodospiraceae bacterium BW-2]|nr:AAA family ATPase [Ectothiorhodospiraceae bacterium BW-2]